jgi:hypothetical protein
VNREVSIEELRKTVEEMHGCSATLLETVSILETFHGKTAWNSVVHVFAITGNPNASKCYAWASPMENGQGRQFFAVLENSLDQIGGRCRANRSRSYAAILIETELNNPTSN